MAQMERAGGAGGETSDHGRVIMGRVVNMAAKPYIGQARERLGLSQPKPAIDRESRLMS